MSSNIASNLITISVALGITAVISGALYSIHRVATKIEKVIGTDVAGRTIMERMTRVEYQLWPNGGGSLADQVATNTLEQRDTAKDVTFIKDVVLQMLQPDDVKIAQDPVLIEAIAVLSEEPHKTPKRRKTNKSTTSAESMAS
jgi:hypothetical protein